MAGAPTAGCWLVPTRSMPACRWCAS